MRRMLLGSMVGILLMASSTFAAEADGAAIVLPAAAAQAVFLGQLPELAPPVHAFPDASENRFKSSVRRPLLLHGLYVGSAGLQAYDAYSTLTAVKAGAQEQNPLMKAAVKSPAAFVAIKAGMTMASIMAAERMWKNNNRVGAILVMAASSGMMAVVAAHNASVLSRVR